MIDVVGLAGTPAAADFHFRIGNDNNPASWSVAPLPASISMRPGAGTGGSTRVELTWADGAIKNTWLEITVKATANTGLAQADVFYFGNAVGESGDSPLNAIVNATDEIGARNNPKTFLSPAGLADRYDFDRDGYVNATDQILARSNANTAAAALRLISFAQASVVGRQLFYNNSNFDGGIAATGASDDAAIASDKTALLPGGTATFANYSSYSRGINGVMIDVVGLAGTPTAADFHFRIGNDNNPASWSVAPLPASISMRPGAGTGGSTRVELTWANGAIKNTWLEITVKATANTGLAHADVFYFGNAVGESGDSPLNAIVNATDEVGARTNSRSFLSTAGITDRYDFDRDGYVNATDQILARSNANTAAAALRLISFGCNSHFSMPQSAGIAGFAQFQCGILQNRSSSR